MKQGWGNWVSESRNGAQAKSFSTLFKVFSSWECPDLQLCFCTKWAHPQTELNLKMRTLSSGALNERLYSVKQRLVDGIFNVVDVSMWVVVSTCHSGVFCSVGLTGS